MLLPYVWGIGEDDLTVIVTSIFWLDIINGQASIVSHLDSISGRMNVSIRVDEKNISEIPP